MTPAPAHVTFTFNGAPVQVPAGANLASVILARGGSFRTSTTGELRAALCGMGTCYECRVTIDGVAHQRACVRECLEGMRVETARG